MQEETGVSSRHWGRVVCVTEKSTNFSKITPSLSLVSKVKRLSLLAEGNQTPYVQRSQYIQEQMAPCCMEHLMMCANETRVYAVRGHRGPLQTPGTLCALFFSDGAQ